MQPYPCAHRGSDHRAALCIITQPCIPQNRTDVDSLPLGPKGVEVCSMKLRLGAQYTTFGLQLKIPIKTLRNPPTLLGLGENRQDPESNSLDPTSRPGRHYRPRHCCKIGVSHLPQISVVWPMQFPRGPRYATYESPTRATGNPSMTCHVYVLMPSISLCHRVLRCIE